MSSDPTVLRVALRYALAAPRSVVASEGYFKVNDPILYGKYKNHHGRIVAFGRDPKGNPLIEIEPVPKGRKSNKIMGLFKIWHDPPPALRVPQPVVPPPAAGAPVAAGVPVQDDDDSDYDDDEDD